MIRLDEVIFERADCCALHASATVDRADGTQVGLQRGELGYYSAAIYRDGALVSRQAGLTAEQAELLLNAS